MEKEFIENAKRHLIGIATDSKLESKRNINQVLIGLQAVKDLVSIIITDNKSDEAITLKEDTEELCESLNEMLCDFGELFDYKGDNLSFKYDLLECIDSEIDSVCRNISAIIKGIYYLVK